MGISQSRVKLIAEIGENHIGSIDIAKMLIEKAAEAKADYAKFQSYKIENFRLDDPEYEWFKKVSLSDRAHFILKEHADKFGIKFLTSPFSIERAKFVFERLGLKEIKVASAMMFNFHFLDYINDYADTVFLSTGTANIAEIREALNHLSKVKKCYVMHCVTQYPCKDQEANLLAIEELEKEFPNYEVGYSDHTVGYLASIMAVSLGAKVIEKHFTFDKNSNEGTDHIISLEPKELKEMIEQIKRVESLLGRPEKSASEGEKKIISFIRNRFK